MVQKATRILLLLCISIGINGGVQAALNGSYTIDPSSPASASNYLTFTAAAQDLNAGIRTDGGPVNGPGVSGAVEFTVAAGTYNEFFVLSSVTGASLTNTITFDGVSAATRTITAPGSATGDATIHLNGADFIRIYNLSVTNTGATNGYAIRMDNLADYNEVKGCTLSVPLTATGSYQIPLIFGTYYLTYGTHAREITIEDNVLRGGQVGAALNGASASFSTGIKFINNTITDVNLYGVYSIYLAAPEIRGNSITMRSGGSTTNYGLRLATSSAPVVSKNTIQGAGSYGMYFSSLNSASSVPANISNNMVGGNYVSTGTAYGMYFTGCRFINLYYNSVWVDGAATTGRPLYITGATSLNFNIRNNTFSYTGSGTTSTAFYCVSSTYLSTLNYNNYYCPSGNVAYLGATYATLPAWVAAFPAFNSNSQNVNPGHTSASDLHAIGTGLSNWGDNSVPVADDIDGQTRPLAPDPTVDVGADEYNVPNYDLDPVAIISPATLALGPNLITVQMANYGLLSLTGSVVRMSYSTDGGLTWPVNEIWSPTALSTTGSTQNYTFAAPFNVVTPGTYNICIKDSLMSVVDADLFDVICESVCSGIGGAYTVDNTLPTSGTNFNSFGALSAALTSCGLVGPTTVTVAPGTYVEQFSLGVIPGSSAVNTLTIDGVSAAACTLRYSVGAINGHVVKLNETDWVTITNMTIDAPGTYGVCVYLQGQANNCAVTNCVLTMPLTSTTTYHIGVLSAGATYSTAGNNADSLLVENNIIRGGYCGVRVQGTSTSVYDNYIRIRGNDIRDMYYYGVYSRYVNNLEVRDNVVRGRGGAGSASAYGMYLYYTGGSFDFSYNHIWNVGRYGMYIYQCIPTGGGSGMVQHNMVGGPWYSSTTNYGMYVYNTSNTTIYNNSVELAGYDGYCIYFSGTLSTGLNVRNNIFSSNGGTFSAAYALYTVYTSSFSNINYNDYWTSGSNLIYWGGTTFTTVAAFKVGVPAYNANSIEIEPNFKSQSDLHLICSLIDNLGTAVGTPVDIDGDARSATTPDMGADEYTAITVSVDIGPDTSACGTAVLDAGPGWAFYVWTDGTWDSTLSVTTSGIYWVEVTDTNNCTASDTANILILDFPAPVYSGDTVSVCIADTLDAGSPGSTYLWSTLETTQTIVPPSTGWYYVDVTNSSGCTATDSVFVDFLANPVISMAGTATFCLGSFATLDAGAQPVGSSFLWSTGASTQVLLASAPGLYWVTVISPDGCIDSDTVILDVLLPPTVFLGDDRVECGAYTLDAGNPGSSYIWSTGATSQTITPGVSGSYSVTVTNGLGCTAIDTVTITAAPFIPVSAGPDQLLCDGISILLDAGYPSYSHTWSTGATTQTITVSLPGTYVVHVVNPANGCIGMDTVTISSSPLDVNLGPDITLCTGETITLDAGSFPIGFAWSTGASTQTIPVTSGGLYSVTVSGTDGCTATDDILVTEVTPPVALFSAPATAPLFSSVSFTDMSSAGVTYLWDFGDGTTSTLANPSHVFLAMLTYTVCLTVDNGTCTHTWCDDITIGAPIGVEDEAFASGIVLYPNPNDGHFYIGFDLPQAEDIFVEVLSIHGQRVYFTQLHNILRHETEVQLPETASGMYVLRVVSASGKLAARTLEIRR